jgi:hypothetical protein
MKQTPNGPTRTGTKRPIQKDFVEREALAIGQPRTLSGLNR